MALSEDVVNGDDLDEEGREGSQGRVKHPEQGMLRSQLQKHTWRSRAIAPLVQLVFFVAHIGYHRSS